MSVKDERWSNDDRSGVSERFGCKPASSKPASIMLVHSEQGILLILVKQGSSGAGPLESPESISIAYRLTINNMDKSDNTSL